MSRISEGITLWNVDNGSALSIRGQLHVMTRDNDWPDGDDIYCKHYRAAEPSKL